MLPSILEHIGSSESQVTDDSLIQPMPSDQELAAVADKTAGEDRTDTDGELATDDLSTESVATRCDHVSARTWVFCTICNVSYCVSCGPFLIAAAQSQARVGFHFDLSGVWHPGRSLDAGCSA